MKDTALDWLLETDEPGVRYLALRDLVKLPSNDPDLLAARRLAHTQGPIAAVLAGMEQEGYWVKSGAGYSPKYRSTVWAVSLLAQLGARVEEDERIGRAVHYVMENTLAPGGQFSYNRAPGGTIDCLQGNLCYALLELGCTDPRLDAAFEWLGRSITGEGVAPLSDKKAPVRYYAYKCGPRFTCGANYGLPCAWGAVKVALAFGSLPAARRTPLLQRALAQTVDFLLGVDPATAAYPAGVTGKPNASWFKFGFPVFYITDVLQIAEALVRLGFGADPRLQNLLSYIRGKQDGEGRWLLEYDYRGKTWVEFGAKRKPNKWVTLRARRALE